ncbi:MAG TPA: tRNA preQ1(34) S-adenosylmethionine ribosyltransferase-isomerase QueA [Steroidobacteraceae bacterium]|nr:tRNA preQ1(34) S-adenosylmethionine ribosyltransferase-isomerase QueA [Steroidobacteraceae bacterium]
MRRADFHYELPSGLIAQAPLERRSASRLLVLDGGDGRIEDRRFSDLPQLLRAADLLVVNDTRVVQARVHAQKETGGRVELLLERALDERRGLFQARSSKPLRVGGTLLLAGDGGARVLAVHDDLVEIEFSEPLGAYLEHHGEVPLPPYIDRQPDPADRERYQTVFARTDGAVAAPTAGLHFDDDLLRDLASAGIERSNVTLHVGAGTFQPVRVENLDEHRMHAERIEVTAETCAAIAALRARRGRVVAVGTTVVRSLETAAGAGELRPCQGETTLFIRPGYTFRAVDALITNFHLPESTLLMLVCAFGGHANVMRAYAHAVRERYRFFSYGDAMLVLPEPAARAAAA